MLQVEVKLKATEWSSVNRWLGNQPSVHVAASIRLCLPVLPARVAPVWVNKEETRWMHKEIFKFIDGFEVIDDEILEMMDHIKRSAEIVKKLEQTVETSFAIDEFFQLT